MNFNYFGQGMVPNQYAQTPKMANWLPADKLAMLKKNLNQFKLSVTEEEMFKGQCNHIDPQTGISALIPDQDGSGGCTCSQCGTHFTARNFSTEEVQGIVQNTLDLLNTIKIMYLSLDPAHALEYFQIVPFIEKIPQLYTIAVNDFKKYEGVDLDELKRKAQELDQIEEANKSELEKANERANSLQAELESLKKANEVRAMREKVASETGVPMNLLTAETEEECTEQANAIKAFAIPTSYPSVKDGGEVQNIGKVSTKQQFAEWANKAFG